MTHTSKPPTSTFVRLDSFNGSFTSPAAMAAAGRFIEREYGPTGYSIGLEASGFTRSVWRCQHSDGSEFRIMTDRWENAWTLPDAATVADAVAAFDAARAERDSLPRAEFGYGVGA